jgi:hypothetical protein
MGLSFENGLEFCVGGIIKDYFDYCKCVSEIWIGLKENLFGFHGFESRQKFCWYFGILSIFFFYLNILNFFFLNSHNSTDTHFTHKLIFKLILIFFFSNLSFLQKIYDISCTLIMLFQRKLNENFLTIKKLDYNF